MKRAFVVGLAGIAGLAAGCAAPAVPPAGWMQGGTPLLLPRATWNVGQHIVDVLPEGRVIVDGSQAFLLDNAGRVFDDGGHAIALLRQDARLVGSGNEDWGAIGPTSAAVPGSNVAWLAIAPSGEVLRFDGDGRSQIAGAWAGCGAWAQSLQTCMLVTYLVATKFRPAAAINRYPNSPYGSPFGSPYGSGFGSGFGLGVPFP